MRHFRLVCLFAILISILVLAQSNRAPVVNQYGQHIARGPHPPMPQNLSRMPQGAPFAQRRAGVFKATEPRRWASPMSGLDFANAVDYGSGGSYPLSVAVADVNGDGKPDLMVANYCANSTCGNRTALWACCSATGTELSRRRFPTARAGMVPVR